GSIPGFHRRRNYIFHGRDWRKPHLLLSLEFDSGIRRCFLHEGYAFPPLRWRRGERASECDCRYRSEWNLAVWGSAVLSNQQSLEVPGRDREYTFSPQSPPDHIRGL